MRAITTSCLLLLASACVWHRGDAVEPNIDHNFGIFGGFPINITEVPFMALFRFEDSDTGCGASIVSEQFLVSAGHCADILKTHKFRITVGTDVYNRGEDYEIDKLYVHPKFDMQTIDYDISVIKLKKKLTFSDRVQKIDMADSSLTPKPGDFMETIGFGLTENNLHPKHLRAVKLPFVDLKQCKQDYENFEVHVTDRMICAGREEGKGSCHGDSGGPLVYKKQLIGVVSWGQPSCALQNYSSVFSYVPSMRDFVDEVMKNNA